jgi:hypothetical protein
MFRRDRVTIEAKLPEPGQFEVEQTNPVSVVEVRTLSGSDRSGRAEFVLKVKPLTLKALQKSAEQIARKALEEPRKAAREEADGKKPPALKEYLLAHRISPPDGPDRLREMYVDVRSAELGTEELQAEWDRLREKRKSWVSQADEKAWETASTQERMKAYGALLTSDLADEHLRAFGLEITTTRSTFANVLATKVAGIHQLLTGSGGDSDEGGSSTRSSPLLPTEITRLGKSLTVTATCRFIPAVNPEDPNARWFNAQRVTCLARHVAVIRVEGQLNPGQGDRVDWWILQDFDAVAVAMTFPDEPAIHHQLFSDLPGPARLRIAAADDAAVTYAFELRPRAPGPAGQRVVVHESPSMVDIEFPY